MSQQLRPPVFILGNPRSGTTLLRLMLTCHPHLVAPPECGFAVWWYDKYKAWPTSGTDYAKSVAHFLDDLLSSRKIETWNLTREELQAEIINRRPGSYPELVSAIYGFYGRRQRPSFLRWGDKNNHYIHHIALLHRLFPTAFFVHIVRDGRDVASSYRDLSKRQINSKYAPRLTGDINEAAHEWRKNLHGIATALEIVPDSQVCEIRFEDLILATPDTLTKVCASFGEEFDESMLRYYELNAEKNLEPKEFLEWKSRTLESPSDAAIGRFRSDLSTAERAAFEEVASDVLCKYGYV